MTQLRQPRTCRHCLQTFNDDRIGRGAPLQYCSVPCRKARRKVLEALVLQRAEPCSIQECEKPRRSVGSEWCEMHYGRNRFNGDPLASKKREATGVCHHCGAKAGRRQLFCSKICVRRDRMGATGRHVICVTCKGSVHEDARMDRDTCSKGCKSTANRAYRYGLAPDALHEMLRTSNGCQVCGTRTRLVVDHDHDTGAVRGLVCPQCNVGLGMFKDTPSLLESAARYLRAGGSNATVGRVESAFTTAEQLGIHPAAGVEPRRLQLHARTPGLDATVLAAGE